MPPVQIAQCIMHEFSIGRSLVNAALEEFERTAGPGARLVQVRVKVGAMRQVVPDNLEMAYQVISRGTAAEGSRLEMVTVPAEGRCTECGWTGGIELPFVVCGRCGSGSVSVEKGMELHLDQLKVEETENH